MDHTDRRPVQFFMDRKLLNKFRYLAATLDKTESDVVNECLAQWIKGAEMEALFKNKDLIRNELLDLLKEKGFEATYCGVIPDNLEKSTNFIKNLKGGSPSFGFKFIKFF